VPDELVACGGFEGRFPTDIFVNAVIQTVEAVIDRAGEVHLLEPLCLPSVRRAPVTIFEESPLERDPLDEVPVSAMLSEAALGRDWDLPSEDEAWSHLQEER